MPRYALGASLLVVPLALTTYTALRALVDRVRIARDKDAAEVERSRASCMSLCSYKLRWYICMQACIHAGSFGLEVSGGQRKFPGGQNVRKSIYL